jgi:hypothetical protein
MAGQSAAERAVRFRREGHSVPAIAKALGVFEGQVRRWLEAAGRGQFAPECDERLSGRDYRASAGDAPAGASARSHMDNLAALRRQLGDFRLAASAEYRAVATVLRRGRADEKVQWEGRTAWRQALARAGYEDADDAQEFLLASLARSLPPDQLDALHDDLRPARCPQSRRPNAPAAERPT